MNVELLKVEVELQKVEVELQKVEVELQKVEVEPQKVEVEPQKVNFQVLTPSSASVPHWCQLKLKVMSHKELKFLANS
ncbi:hypothetical protein [Nostoc favosum]|uniref:hypothetical protein n=1 Tax=Nostoc favosum TaxID=2907819 RepID=UPI001E58A26C|nr:hypothetical protein [Nostoc favosum]